MLCLKSTSYMTKQFKNDSSYKSFSLQSIFTDTHEAIDRPDITWEKHRIHKKTIENKW